MLWECEGHNHHNLTWIQVLLVNLPFLPGLKVWQVEFNEGQTKLISQWYSFPKLIWAIDGEERSQAAPSTTCWCDRVRVSKVRGNICKGFWVQNLPLQSGLWKDWGAFSHGEDLLVHVEELWGGGHKHHCSCFYINIMENSQVNLLTSVT